MRSSARSGLGILYVASAVGLGIVSMLFPYVWGAFLPSSVHAGQESFYWGSLTLWLALFLWGYEELRLRGLSRPPALPA